MKNLKLVLLALLVTVFTGCKNKKENPLSPINNVSSSLEEFFDTNGATKQAFTVNVDNSAITIVGEKGSEVTFPKDAFIDSTGQLVTGNIQIELIEILDQAEMILSDKPTTSNGQLLVSGGELFIGATSNGEQLQLQDGMTILITLPSDAVDNAMTLFTGGVDSIGMFDWTQVPNVIAKSLPADFSWNSFDSTSYFYYDPSKYVFSVTNFGWINCDKFNSQPKTSITFNCAGVSDNINFRGYAVFKNINSVVSLNTYTSVNGTFTNDNLPIGEEVSIVVFYMKDDKQKVGIKEITISADLNLQIDLQELPEADIVNLIKQKFN